MPGFNCQRVVPRWRRGRTLITREEIVSRLIEPRFHTSSYNTWESPLTLQDALSKLEARLRNQASDRLHPWRELYARRGVVPVERHFKTQFAGDAFVTQYDTHEHGHPI